MNTRARRATENRRGVVEIALLVLAGLFATCLLAPLLLR